MASVGTAYVRVVGDLSTLNKQLVANLHPAKLGRLGKVAGIGIGTGLAAGVVGKGLFDLGSRFDEQFDKIRVGTGKTGAALKGLEGDFKAVTQDTPADFDTVGTAISGISSRLNLTDEPLRKLAKQLVQLSKITGTDIQENVESITRLFGDWSIKTGDQASQLDKLFRVSQRTGIGVADLSRLLVQFGAPLRALGFDLDAAAVTFGKFEKEGVNLSTLLPGLRFGLKSFIAPTGAAAKALEQLGIKTREPAKALPQTIAALKGMSNESKAAALAADIFGKRAGTDMARAIIEGRFEVDNLLKSIRGGHDTINQAEKDTRDFGEQWQLLKNRVFVAMEPVASKFFATVGDGMEKLATADFDQIGADIGIGKIDLGPVRENIRAAVDSIKSILDTGLVKFIGGNILGGVKRAMQGVAQAFRESLATFAPVLRLLDNLLHLRFGKAFGDLKDIVRHGVGAAVGVLRVTTAPMREIAARIGGAVVRGITSGLRKVGDLGAGILRALKRGLSGETLIPGFKIHGPGFLPDVKFGGVKIPALAKGGTLRKRSLALVGEEGPELAELPAGTRVHSHPASKRIAKNLGIPGFGQEVAQRIVGAKADQPPTLYQDIVQRLVGLKQSGRGGVSVAPRPLARDFGAARTGGQPSLISALHQPQLGSAGRPPVVVQAEQMGEARGDTHVFDAEVRRRRITHPITHAARLAQRVLRPRLGKLEQRQPRAAHGAVLMGREWVGSAVDVQRLGRFSDHVRNLRVRPAAGDRHPRSELGPHLEAVHAVSLVKDGVVGLDLDGYPGGGDIPAFRIGGDVRRGDTFGPHARRIKRVGRGMRRSAAKQYKAPTRRRRPLDDGPAGPAGPIDRKGRSGRRQPVSRADIHGPAGARGPVTRRGRPDTRSRELPRRRKEDPSIFGQIERHGVLGGLKRFALEGITGQHPVLPTRGPLGLALSLAMVDSPGGIGARVIQKGTKRPGTVVEIRGNKRRVEWDDGKSALHPKAELVGRPGRGAVPALPKHTSGRVGKGLLLKSGRVITWDLKRGSASGYFGAPEHQDMMEALGIAEDAVAHTFVIGKGDTVWTTAAPGTSTYRDDLRRIRGARGGRGLRAPRAGDPEPSAYAKGGLVELARQLKGRAFGGQIPGYSRTDDQVIAVRGGEEVHTPETHVPLVNRALRFASEHGVVPFASTQEMFRKTGAASGGQAFASGGTVRPKKRGVSTSQTGRVPGLAKADTTEDVGKALRQRMRDVWFFAAPYFQAAGEAMPRVRFPKHSKKYAWVNPKRNDVAYGPAARRQFAQGDDWAEQTLLHEWAHIHQPLLPKWQAEGGADLFANKVSRRIYKALDIPFHRQGVSREYLPYVNRVLKEKDNDWVMRGQFDARQAAGKGKGDSNDPARRGPDKRMGTLAIGGKQAVASAKKVGKLIGFPNQGTHNLGNWQSDNAVDVSLPVGAPLYAPADGKVTKTGGSGSFSGRFGGHNMTLKTAGNAWFLAHLKSIRERASFTRGQKIATSGSANGVPHLHLGVQSGYPNWKAVVESSGAGAGEDAKPKGPRRFKKLSLGQYVTVAKQVGFPDPALAAAVFYAESMGNVGAENHTTKEWSLGGAQINVLAHKKLDNEKDRKKLQDDIFFNFREAKKISGGGKNFKPWTMYTNNKYEDYLGKARKSGPQKLPSRASEPGKGSSLAEYLAYKIQEAEFAGNDKAEYRYINRAQRYWRRVLRRSKSMRPPNLKRAGTALSTLTDLRVQKKALRPEIDENAFSLGELTTIGQDVIVPPGKRFPGSGPPPSQDHTWDAANNRWTKQAVFKSRKVNIGGIQKTLDRIDLDIAQAALTETFDKDGNVTPASYADDIGAATEFRNVWEGVYQLALGNGTITQKTIAATELKQARDALKSIQDEAKSEAVTPESLSNSTASAAEQIKSFLASLGDLFKQYGPNFKTIAPTIPGFASGGVFMAGEKGRELIHAPSGTRVHSATDTKEILRERGTENITNNVTQNITFQTQPKDMHGFSRSAKVELERAI